MNQNGKNLKKELLRELVRDNVAAQDGQKIKRKASPSVILPARWPRMILIAITTASLGIAAAVVADRQVQQQLEVVIDDGYSGARFSLPPRDDKLFEIALPKALDPSVVRLEVRTIAIDAGHGGEDPGTKTGTLNEKDLTLDVSRRLSGLLEDGGYEVLMTRNDDTYLNLKQRAMMANSSGADLFLSIHVNWFPNRRARGVETYYLGSTDDPLLESVAAAENENSGYSLSDYRSLLESIYDGVRQTESQLLATFVQTALHRRMQGVNPELEDRGVKSAPFVVLSATEIPAVLVEVSCLSNQREAELLEQGGYRQRIAEALFAGIRGYTDLSARAELSAAQ